MILPAFASCREVTLAGAADTREEARRHFHETYRLPAFGSVTDLARSDGIDVIWVATPNGLHAEHAIAAAEAGKHVVCEKPMALTLAECDRMIAAAAANGVRLMLGHSKLRQAPIRWMREIIAGGELGRVVQIATWNSNDWLQRPRFADEVDTDKGGGILYRQAPHQVDIVRYLAGSPLRTVRAVANRADPHFPTEGNYSALLVFDDGIAASLVYNAYGHFDISELNWIIGEGGQIRDPAAPSRPRATGPSSPDIRYAPRRSSAVTSDRRQPFYGLTIISCERGVIRQSPEGLFVYAEGGRREVPCDTTPPVLLDFAELRAAMDENRRPFPDGAWGRTTLEVCLAMLQSSRESREVELPTAAGS
jgi:phthalate 4,5-cis-dihydrodiol dehydrogenase